ncbi:hypothetical protein ED28_04530 [[Pantoea] beijingensis]|uniref:DNA-binding protein n=1 Tax=[Pantoea] beijingensis TaxID=1324864 RepID=A0A443IG91_9GAMM|nr:MULTISPECIES: DNA-binding protein [Erwiniaceae]RWR03069.1 hypothetical protein ED28_04530 [[Pantoea] beijingensis]
MNLYHFILTLDGVTSQTPGLEDTLFESGCDDALVCFYGQSVYLEFDRESANFRQAVLSAIADIESATINAKVLSVDSILVGLSDIAAAANLSRQAITMLKDGTRGTGDFPSPLQRLKGTSPLWSWASVADWLYRKGKITRELAINAQEMEEINLALQLRTLKAHSNVEALIQQLARD